MHYAVFLMRILLKSRSREEKKSECAITQKNNDEPTRGKLVCAELAAGPKWLANWPQTEEHLMIPNCLVATDDGALVIKRMRTTLICFYNLTMQSQVKLSTIAKIKKTRWTCVS